jgi:hypothetical protein
MSALVLMMALLASMRLGDAGAPQTVRSPGNPGEEASYGRPDPLPPPGSRLLGDTVVWSLGRRIIARPLGQVPAELRLGLGRVEPAFEPDFPSAPEWSTNLLRPGESLAERSIARLEETALEARRATLIAAGFKAAAREEKALEVTWMGVAAAAHPIPPATTGSERAAPLGDLFGDAADIGMQVRGRAELGGDWTRFRPCDPSVQFTCNPGLFPQLTPDIQFGVQVGGTISDRVYVNVDYDQTREFSATNNINLYYEGLEGETIQRVEVGDVTFSLPRSRYLTRGIPAGNFGFRATGQLGPIDFQTVWAQQKGDLSSRQLQVSGVGGSEGFVQEDTLVIDDADYLRAQFFFLVDPREIRGYPHIDVLSLSPDAAAPDLVPGADPIQLYRFENDPVTRQQVEGYIQADAVATLAGDTLEESGWFRFLQAGVDYFVHPSGMWLALRRPLRRDEMLAVTYVAVSGDSIGDYNPERLHNAGVRPRLQLLKASGGNHQPGRPTWDLDMHQVYRVSGSNDVEVQSVGLTLSLGEVSAGRTFARGTGGEDITFLRLFGLDEGAPVDVLDRAFVYQPARDSFEEQPVVSGTFIVFPTLKPFAVPPPVPSLGLSASQTSTILGGDANPDIYDAEDPFIREGAGLFRLTIPFRIRSQGLVSSVSLGALGIRDGSERIYLGERLLQSGTDYVIDYDIGQVTLLDPRGLFASAPGDGLRATWEQKTIFDLAPTSVFGFSARYDLGTRGDLNFLGLYQIEKALANRPQLGVEPASVLLGGVNGRLEFGASWLDRALQNVPGLQYQGSSSLVVNGELAMSLPNPNRRDDVFLDDFDSTNELRLPVISSGWFLGSATGSREGADPVLPATMDQTDAADIVWQHTWVAQGASGDSIGVFEGYVPRSEIDRQINVTGTQTREQGLRLTFGDPHSGSFDGRRWRSITTLLSTTGLDLSKSESLEFYASQGDSLTLVLDLGTVSEDVLFVDSAGRVSGIKPSPGSLGGLGRLDQEADPVRGEIWNDPLDRLGVWGEDCLAVRGRAYRIGDPRANCTRGNGRADTEDLNANGNLDLTERHRRYVVKLDGSSAFLARTRQETGTSFRLFRIPLRGPEGVDVEGAFSEADWRSVRHLRITVVGERPETVILARPRIVGSRWVKRSVDGVARGIVGDTAGTAGLVEVTSVSALTAGRAYRSPPGVLEELDDPTQAFGGEGVEFNEKSLGIRYSDVQPEERAEVYYRFPQRPRNFLTYRQARIWVVAREGDWGLDSPRYFFLKVGSDPDNFYLFRTRLTPAADPEAVLPQDWLPEIVVDFDRWLSLRQLAEEVFLDAPLSPGDPPLELWTPDSTYAVVIKDRARGPNLAQVRELSLGVWNGGELPTSGEMWVDEFRFSSPLRDPGFAGTLEVDLNAADFLTTRVSISNQGALFRQLEDEPSYQRDRAVNLSSTIRLDHFVPQSWGIDVPLTVTHGSTRQDPTFLAQSDLRADRLPRLRKTSNGRTRVALGFRKRTPTENPWLGAVLDGLDARLALTGARATTVTMEQESRVLDAGLGYRREFGSREIGLIPDFLKGAVRAVLPAFLERRIADSRLRWSPDHLFLGSAFLQQEREAFRFDGIVTIPADSAVRPTRSPRKGLESTARIGFQPFPSLTAEADFVSTRDLLSPQEATADPGVQPLIAAERRNIGGLDLGWETQRSLRTRLGFRPELAQGIRGTLNVTTSYLSERNANLVRRRILGGDTARALQRNVNGMRDVLASLSIEPRQLAEGILGAPEEGVSEGSWAEAVRGLSEAVAPVSVSWRRGLNTRFNRSVVDPGPGVQLGWGNQDDLRFLDGDTAAVLTDRTAWTVRSGLNLPLGLTAGLDYSETLASILDLRSDREFFSRSWPSVRLAVRDLPLPESVRPLLQQLTIASGYQETLQESHFGVGGQQRRRREEERIPLELTVRWGRALNTSYRGSFQSAVGRDPTGETEQEREVHDFSLVSSFVPPGDLGRRLVRPVQISLRYQYAFQSDCRITVGSVVCVPFVEQLNRSLNLTLDTVVSQLEVGLQLSYTDRQSFVGQRNGSTQFQLGFFGQFLFAAGPLPGLGDPQ